MKEYEFSFGEIIILRDDLAEIIVKKGVVMNEDIIKECHSFLVKHLKTPFSLLINKKYEHSYTGEAQTMISNLKELKVMGVVVGAKRSIIPSDILSKINQFNDSSIKLFNKRNQALEWLETA